MRKGAHQGREADRAVPQGGEEARTEPIGLARPPRGGVRLPDESPLLLSPVASSCPRRVKSPRRGLPARLSGPHSDLRSRAEPGLRKQNQTDKATAKMPRKGSAAESLTEAIVLRTSPRHEGMWPDQSPMRNVPYALVYDVGEL